MTRFLRRLWKPAISLIVLALVWRKIDIENVWDNFSNARLTPLFLALVIFLFAQIISSMRYVYAMKALNRAISLRLSLRVHFIGMWFNQILPGGVGGDLIKVIILKNQIGVSRAIRGTLLDRISGLVFLILSILLLLPAYHSSLQNKAMTLTLAAIAVTFFLALFALIHFNGKRAVRELLPKPLRHLALLLNDVVRFRQARFLFQQLWTSSVVHANGIVAYALIGLSLGIDLRILFYLLLVPLVFLISLIPISFGGWGVREAGTVGIFSLVALPAEQAFAMSVLFGLMVICASLPGGGLLLFSQGARR